MDAGWEKGARTLRARDAKGDSHVVVGPLTSGSMGHTRGTETTDSGHVIAFNPYRTMTQPGEYVEGFKPDEIHDALTANSAPKGPPLVVAPQVRRLTPLECERLQGFPDNWTAGQADTQRYRQMGNAVAVPVVEWLGRNLAKYT
jgi:site-specific DNA-cytosine methylase